MKTLYTAKSTFITCQCECTQVADRGDDLQIWRVDACIVRMQYHRQMAMGSHPAWGLGRQLTPHKKKKNK
jgi:hypothetical protein